MVGVGCGALHLRLPTLIKSEAQDTQLGRVRFEDEWPALLAATWPRLAPTHAHDTDDRPGEEREHV